MIKKILLCGLLALFVAIFAQPALEATEMPLSPGQQLGGTAASGASNVQLPPGFENPSMIWVQEKLMLGVFCLVLIYLIRNSRRAGELTFGMLLFISSTTMFWQEPYADWGGYLLFNPQFNLMPWGSTLWTTPNKPWATIWQYGPFFAGIYSFMLWLVRKLQTRYPSLGNLGSVLVIGIPTFYLFDLYVEGSSVKNGWYSYTEFIGPAIVTAKGNFPIIYPALLFVLYAVLTLWVLSLRGANGHARFESWFGVERIAGGWQRQMARVGAWILVMNGLFLLLLTGPLVAIRALFGSPSALVP